MPGQAFLVPIGVAFHFDLLEFSWCATACMVVIFSFLHDLCVVSTLITVFGFNCVLLHRQVQCRQHLLWCASLLLLLCADLFHACLMQWRMCKRCPLHACNEVLCYVAALHGPTLCAAPCFPDTCAISKRPDAPQLVAQLALTQNHNLEKLNQSNQPAQASSTSWTSCTTSTRPSSWSTTCAAASCAAASLSRSTTCATAPSGPTSWPRCRSLRRCAPLSHGGTGCRTGPASTETWNQLDMLPCCGGGLLRTRARELWLVQIPRVPPEPLAVRGHGAVSARFYNSKAMRLHLLL